MLTDEGNTPKDKMSMGPLPDGRVISHEFLAHPDENNNGDVEFDGNLSGYFLVNSLLCKGSSFCMLRIGPGSKLSDGNFLRSSNRHSYE